MKQLAVIYGSFSAGSREDPPRFVIANVGLRGVIVDEKEQLVDHVFVGQIELDLHVHTISLSRKG